MDINTELKELRAAWVRETIVSVKDVLRRQIEHLEAVLWVQERDKRNHKPYDQPFYTDDDGR